jgi:hypothetical protein
MALVEFKKDPSDRDLKYFGLLFALFCFVVAVIFAYRFGAMRLAENIFGFGLVVALVFYLFPITKKWIFRAWMYLTYPIGFTISLIMMVIIYFGLFTPIGFVMRLWGRDSLARRIDKECSTYWTEMRPADKLTSYFRQF